MAGPRTKDDDGGLVKAAQRWNIIFFHPDLGIGGAERLIVDAAVGLQEQGHKVTIFTSHCDPAHCFEEARDGTFSDFFWCSRASDYYGLRDLPFPKQLYKELNIDG